MQMEATYVPQANCHSPDDTDILDSFSFSAVTYPYKNVESFGDSSTLNSAEKDAKGNENTTCDTLHGNVARSL